MDADVGEELEQLAPTTGKGDERTEVGGVLGKVGAAQEAPGQTAGGDGEPAGDITLGERDGADLPLGDQPAVAGEGGEWVEGAGCNTDRQPGARAEEMTPAQAW